MDRIQRQVLESSAQLSRSQQALAESAVEVDLLRQNASSVQEALHAEVKGLRSELMLERQAGRAAVDARDAEIELLRAAISGAAEAHRASTARAEVLEHELRTQVERLAARCEGMDARNAELAATVEWQQRDLDVFRAEVPRLEQRIATQRDALESRARELESQRQIGYALRAIVDERWRERVALFTCRTWRLWAPVREVLTRVIRRRKNMSMRLAIADAWGALRGRPPLDPPPWRDPSLDGLHE
jgi:chromosome segregation ATPase